MPEQYVATDKRTGLEVQVTGNFPDHPQDRIRIARTANLFTRLTSTILSMEQESDRREAFIAVETQMELAEALIRHDMAEVQRLIQETLQRMGISPDQVRELEEELRKRLGDMGDLGNFGSAPPPDQPPPDDQAPRV
jgi:DNA/RNA-binding domain of Phe-tRNA-synthetase-like protein